MADIAALDIVIGAKVDGAVNGLTLVEKTLLEISAVSQRMAASLDVISNTLTTVGTVAVKTDGSLDVVSKGLNEVGNSAVKAGTDVVATTAQMSTGFAAVEASIDKIAADFHAKWDPIIAEAEAAAVAVKKTDQSFGQLKTTISSFPVGGPRVALPKLDESLKNIKPGASQATQALTDLGRVAQDLPFGFIAIQNNLGPLFESFGRLAAESKKTGTSLLSNLGAALSGPAGIGVALSVVSAAITLFQLGFSAWTRGFGAGKKAIDDATKANEDFTKSLNDARAGAISTGMQLQNFVNIARDGSKPLEQRNEALKEANRLMGEHGEKLTLANVGTKAITDQTNLFTEALINQAVATKYADRAADLIIKQTEASREYARALDDSNKKTKDANELNRIAGTGTGGIGGGGNIVATNNATTALNKLVGAATNYKLITKDLNQVNTDLAATQEKVTASFGKIGEKTKETAKHIVTVAEVMKDLNNELKFITLKEGAENVDLATERINALEGALKKLVEIKAPLKDIVNVIGQIQILKAPIDFTETQKNISKQLPEIAKTVKTGLDEQFKDMKGFDISTIIAEEGFEANKKTEKLIAIGKEAARIVALGFKLPENFEFLNDDDREKLIKKFEDIAKIVKDTVANTFIKIAENIGNLKNPLAGIFELLGNSLIELGKQVVIGSKLVAAISKSLNAAFSGLPTAGILVGIGLIITGSLLKKFAPFAEGGIVTGPTRALIGEAGPEVVFPLDRLREFIQPAQSQVVVLETRVRGSDIWLSQSRTNERRRRTY